MTKLSQVEISQLKDTMARARGGRASLPTRGRPRPLRESRTCPAAPPSSGPTCGPWRPTTDEPHRTAGKDIFTGVVSGIVTHVLLGGLL